MVGPEQVTPALVYVGVTTIEATTGVEPVLTAIKDWFTPEPVPDNPILVSVLVHE